jgi:hypothetical protein
VPPGTPCEVASPFVVYDAVEVVFRRGFGDS